VNIRVIRDSKPDDTKEKLVKNLFVYGETVSGDNFCDRARETKDRVEFGAMNFTN
jgi:hypothetical protein